YGRPRENHKRRNTEPRRWWAVKRHGLARRAGTVLKRLPLHRLFQAQDAAVPPRVGLARGKAVKRQVRGLKQMAGNEGPPLRRPWRGVFHAALPFRHRPAVEAGLGQEGEDALEIPLAITERAEPARPLRPGLVAAVDADPAARAKLGVLDVEAFDPPAVQL